MKNSNPKNENRSFSYIVNEEVQRLTNYKYSSYEEYCSSVYKKFNILSFISIAIVLAATISAGMFIIFAMTEFLFTTKGNIAIVAIIALGASIGTVLLKIIEKFETNLYAKMGNETCNVDNDTLDIIYDKIEYHVGSVNRCYNLNINQMHQINKRYEYLKNISENSDLPDFLIKDNDYV